MSNSLATAVPMSTLDDDAWDDHIHGDQWQPAELAAALYAQALADKQQRTALLHEAVAKLDALPVTLHGLHDVRLFRGLLSAAERGT